MNKNVNRLLELAGDKGKYQYAILFLAFSFWITLDLLSISLPYLEKTSVVKVWENSINNYQNVSLNYTLCEKENFANFKKNKLLSNNNNTILTYIERSQHSWVIEYEIECDKVKTGLIGSVTFFGVLVGSIMFQFIPDTIGRKKSVILGGAAYSFVLLSFNFVSNYYYVLFLCFILQTFAYLGLLSVFVLSNEITAPESRSLFGAIINSAFSFSGIIFILLYKLLDDWRICFTIASMFNLIITLIFCSTAHESPRYYNTRGEYKKLIKTITSIAIYNGENVENLRMEINKFEGPKMIEVSIDSNNHEKVSVIDKDEEASLKLQPADTNFIDTTKQSKYHGYFSLFTHPSLRTTFLINCYLWFSTSGIYYGLSIYLKNLPGDIYFNGIFIYTSEILSYIISGWIINVPKFGRKGSMIIFEFISLSGYLSLLLFNFENYYKTLLSFLARFSISGVYNILYTYSAEVYPTVVRAKGFGFNSVSARLGGIIFPLMIELFQEKVIFIFTLLNLLALLLIFLLPETYGKVLEDDINE